MASKKTGKRKYTKRSEKAADSGAPEGFKKVEGLKIAGFWTPDLPEQSVQGHLGESISKRDQDGKTNVYYLLHLSSDEVGGTVHGVDEAKKRRKVTVGAGETIGVGGAVLVSRLRNVNEGAEVIIQYKGLDEVKVKGRNPARLYEVYEREA